MKIVIFVLGFSSPTVKKCNHVTYDTWNYFTFSRYGLLLKKFLLYLTNIQHKRNILKPLWFCFFFFRSPLNGFPSIFFFLTKTNTIHSREAKCFLLNYSLHDIYVSAVLSVSTVTTRILQTLKLNVPYTRYLKQTSENLDVIKK